VRVYRMLILFLILPLAGCATPARVKTAASDQLMLLTRMDEAVGTLEVHFAERIYANKNAAAFNRQQRSIAEEAQKTDLPPETRLKSSIGLARLKELNDLVEHTANPEPTARPDTKPIKLQDVVFTKSDVDSLSLLRLQLKLIHDGHVVIERYLAVDVFGDDEVKKATKLAADLRGLTQ
jgi:hypothetical protein